MRQAKGEKKAGKILAKGIKKALKSRRKWEKKGYKLPLWGPVHPPVPQANLRAHLPGPPHEPGGTPAPRPYGEKYWVLATLVLALPSVLFVLLYQLVVVHGYFGNKVPEPLDLSLVWTTLFTGKFGPIFTASALVPALGASFSRGVRWRVRAGVWLIVSLSVLACWYLWQVPV
jgi:hypothetical protein